MPFPLGYGVVWARQHMGTIPAREAAFPRGILKHVYFATAIPVLYAGRDHVSLLVN